jgi:hypothetical protein
MVLLIVIWLVAPLLLHLKWSAGLQVGILLVGRQRCGRSIGPRVGMSCFIEFIWSE